MNFQNKVVIISGASRGLGHALAMGFYLKGANLGLCAKNVSGLNELTSKLNTDFYFSSAFGLTDFKESEKFITNIVKKFGRIDVLINNASVLGKMSDILSYPEDTWKHVIDVNVNGTFFLTKYVLTTMMNQKSGSIINVSSSVGIKGRKLWGAYSVSKFAIEGFTQILADELLKYNIRVNSVNPGPIATDMRKEAYPDEDHNKLKKPEEILEKFFYLASDVSKKITGKNFNAQK